MAHILRTAGLALAAIASIGAFAPSAHAGCGDAIGGKVNARKVPSSYEYQDGSVQLISADQPASIVGLWSVSFTGTDDAKNPYSDFGYQQWHSDGTEFLNSGGREAVTQNFCLGVWKQTGPRTYKLNHFALSYAAQDEPATGIKQFEMDARVNIRETVSTSFAGDKFSGTFTIDIYDPTTGTTLLDHIWGKVSGVRITAD